MTADNDRPTARRRRSDRNIRSNRRSAKARGKRRVSPIVWILLVVSLAFLAYAIINKNTAQTRLDNLHAEREAAKKRHEDELVYYVNLRKNSGVEDIINKYSAMYQVDSNMVSAVIARESHYDMYAQSRVGARGLMQIMEDTGKWIAGKLNVEGYTYEHLFDPDINIRFGTWYLSYLSDNFGGDPILVASAYHAGLSNVKLWLLRHSEDGVNLGTHEIPMDDTKDYVKKVMNAYALYYENYVVNQ
ncbi:MAG: lytic transglycosylase domain-containing protein [Christensenellaceae bacterium]|nr:lytic transglycosylase domain-containing protein [Christensenellaceae bacterium]